MKTKIIHIALIAFLSISQMFAQDVTTVRANSSDISDNLDLKAVASIFGDSRDLEDFERRLNDPDLMISNLDLNGDNRVDYLRVIEVTENNTHLIIIQSVLGLDTFQDVATVEVERDRYNNVQVQVVGDVYMYGQDYIYEPVYVARPAIFSIFWVSSYRPYYSPWYWGYYPTYYSYWAPCNNYRYRNHIHTHVINHRHTYTYVNTRRSDRAASLYSSRRSNAYERQHPNTSFASRNSNVSNRHALEQNRSSSRVATKSDAPSRNAVVNSTRSNNVKSSNINTVRSKNVPAKSAAVRSNNATASRNSETVRSAGSPSRNSSAVKSNSSSRNSNATPARQTRTEQPARVERSAPAVKSAPASSRNNTISSPRSTPSVRSTPAASPSRQSAPARQSNGGGRQGGNRRG
jgi:hypothetical protein